MSKLMFVLSILAAAMAGCQTPPILVVPAGSTDVVGPPVAPSVLQRAADSSLLFPAKTGPRNHQQHHKGAAEPVDAGVDEGASDDTGHPSAHGAQ